MTPTVMLYSLVIALLVSGSALTSERILAELQLPRRFIWFVALLLSLALPTYTLLTNAGADGLTIEASGQTVSGAQFVSPSTPIKPTSVVGIEIQKPFNTWPNWYEFSTPFAIFWIASSASILLFYFLSWLFLRRKLSHAKKRHLDGTEVRILDEYGPSVFGFFRPQIILPGWLFDSDPSLQQIVLKHERQHIQAHDQLTLFAALMLIAAAPWNLPLWWQLRRLRCAIEIDCDARILRDATSEKEYGEALVKVQQHRARMPMGAIALIEPVTQLERRIQIMMNRKNRRRYSIVGIYTLAAVYRMA